MKRNAAVFALEPLGYGPLLDRAITLAVRAFPQCALLCLAEALFGALITQLNKHGTNGHLYHGALRLLFLFLSCYYFLLLSPLTLTATRLLFATYFGQPRRLRREFRISLTRVVTITRSMFSYQLMLLPALAVLALATAVLWIVHQALVPNFFANSAAQGCVTIGCVLVFIMIALAILPIYLGINAFIWSSASIGIGSVVPTFAILKQCLCNTLLFRRSYAYGLLQLSLTVVWGSAFLMMRLLPNSTDLFGWYGLVDTIFGTGFGILTLALNTVIAIDAQLRFKDLPLSLPLEVA